MQSSPRSSFHSPRQFRTVSGLKSFNLSVIVIFLRCANVIVAPQVNDNPKSVVSRKLRFLLRSILITLACVVSGVASANSVQHNGTSKSHAAKQLPTVAQSHALELIVGDMILSDNVVPIRRAASSLPDSERFDFLAEWVLPGASHAAVRMSGMFTQTNPDASEGSYGDGVQDDPRGGELVSPVFDLLAVAKTLGRLPELRRRIESPSVIESEQRQRARTALLLLAAMATDDKKTAASSAQKLQELTLAASPVSVSDLWPETLAVWYGLEHFGDEALTSELLTKLYSRHADRFSPSGMRHWHVHIQSLFAKQSFLQRGGKLDVWNRDASLAQWIPVSRSTAESRGMGFPETRWHWDGSELKRLGRHGEDFLLFRSPLRGNFDVEGEKTARGIFQFLGAGNFHGCSGPAWMASGNFRNGEDAELAEKRFAAFASAPRFRGFFRDGTFSVDINGRNIHQQVTSAQTEPWVGMHSNSRDLGALKNVRISGHPTVLNAVDMSASADLEGWLSYFSHDTAAWIFRPERHGHGLIVGARRSELSGTFCESLFRYHRPLTEDGTVEYEFYYALGSVHTHPALDRIAFLLDPSGVRTHSITDAPFAQSRISPDETTVFANSRESAGPLPLMPDAWNHMKVEIHGDTVTLVLNQQHIYEQPVAATNSRTFGLFHYADQTEARVRHVVMKGDWPKAVPPIAEQELSNDQTLVLEERIPQLKSVFRHDFPGDGLPADRFLVPKSLAPNLSVGVNKDGLQFTTAVSGDKQRASINMPIRLTMHGDLDIEAAFESFSYTESDVAQAVMTLAFDDEAKHMTQLRRARDQKDQQLAIAVSSKQREGSRIFDDVDRLTTEASSGRLRLARRGDTVYSLIAEGDSTVFQLIGRHKVSDAKTTATGLTLHSVATGLTRCSVVWKSVLIRAERLTYMPPKGGTRGMFVMSAADTNKPTFDTKPREIRRLSSLPEGYRFMGSPKWCNDGKHVIYDQRAKGGDYAATEMVLVNVHGEPRTRVIGMGMMPSMSRDGKQVVYSKIGSGIVKANLDGTGKEQLDRSGWTTQWSPDGEHIAWGKRNNYVVMNLKTGQRRDLLTPEQSRQISKLPFYFMWSHDSRSIVFKGTNQDGQYILVTATFDDPDSFKIVSTGHVEMDRVSWHPDNRRICCLISPSPKAPSQIYIIDTKGDGKPVLLPGQPSTWAIYDCEWSPDGKEVVICADPPLTEIEWTKN